jgi:hypothetical protein
MPSHPPKRSFRLDLQTGVILFGIVLLAVPTGLYYVTGTIPTVIVGAGLTLIVTGAFPKAAERIISRLDELPPDELAERRRQLREQPEPEPEPDSEPEPDRGSD